MCAPCLSKWSGFVEEQCLGEREGDGEETDRKGRGWASPMNSLKMHFKMIITGQEIRPVCRISPLLYRGGLMEVFSNSYENHVQSCSFLFKVQAYSLYSGSGVVLCDEKERM